MSIIHFCLVGVHFPFFLMCIFIWSLLNLFLISIYFIFSFYCLLSFPQKSVAELIRTSVRCWLLNKRNSFPGMIVSWSWPFTDSSVECMISKHLINCKLNNAVNPVRWDVTFMKWVIKCCHCCQVSLSLMCVKRINLVFLCLKISAVPSLFLNFTLQKILRVILIFAQELDLHMCTYHEHNYF